MKIYYIAEATIPSFSAYSNHVIKMSSFLSQKRKFTLFALCNSEYILKDNIFNFYNVKKFNIKIFRTAKNNFFTKILFFFFILSNLDYCEKKTFICRSPLISLLLLVLNFSVILEIHHPFGNKLFEQILKLLKNKKNFIRIILITHKLKKYFLKKKIFNEEKILVLPDAADYKFIIEKKTLHKNNVIGYIGSFYKGRGLELINRLAKILSDYKFYLIGYDKDLPYSKLRFPKNIIFLGFKNQKELRKIYDYFDIVIAPYDKEVKVFGNHNLDTSKFMSPLKIFEYMSYKKLIISSNHQVLKEVLKNNINCFLCNSNSPQNWAEIIRKISNDSNKKKIISQRAFLDFKKNYTWKRRANKILDLI